MRLEDFTPMLFIAALFVAFHLIRQKFLGPTITPEELADKLEEDSAYLLDVRGPDEFAGSLGHIDGAVNVPVGELAAEIAELGPSFNDAKDNLIVTICRTNNRSPRAARMLRDAGFTNVQVLKGGMTAWSRKKLPVA